MYEVWAAVVDEDPAASMVRVNLLLNRASESPDVESYLPHEGKVVLRLHRDATVAVRVPRWVDRAKVTCGVNDNAVPFAWLGSYVVLESRKSGETLTLTFPIVETVETWSLAWQVDRFWQESTKAPAYWPKREPVRYTLTFRGNTLAKIEPRDTVAGFALYADRSLDRFRAQAPMHQVSRFARALKNSSN
jgi:hypothetical protein